MTNQVYQGLRFDPDTGLGLSASGGLAMIEGDAAVRQSIWLLLSTLPGERVMRPDYGCELQKLVYSPNDDTTAGLAIHYVRQAMQNWEPRVEIAGLDAVRYPERPEQLVLILHYRVRATLQAGILDFPINLAGEKI
jgi:phage baseplate assembly protein W